MGAFKPLLPFGKKTVIECCIDYLRAAGVDEIVVVLGHRADEIRQKISDVTFAVNPDPDSAMGASIAVGVSALPETTQATFIALVDHPAVPATVVSTLLESWENGARIVLGGIAPSPVEIKEAATALIGKPLTDEPIQAAAEAAYVKARPLDNTDFVYQWRKQMARQYTLRALRDLL